jgi:hypothetical protein
VHFVLGLEVVHFEVGLEKWHFEPVVVVVVQWYSELGLNGEPERGRDDHSQLVVVAVVRLEDIEKGKVDKDSRVEHSAGSPGTPGVEENAGRGVVAAESIEPAADPAAAAAVVAVVRVLPPR